MSVTESDVERYLVKLVAKAGGVCIKLPAVYTSGIPDRLVLLPKGALKFVELKRPKGGKHAELQKYWQQKLLTLGFESEVVCTKEDALAAITAMQERAGHEEGVFEQEEN